jgi:succinoglycan biosynthesis transport protein ExoP
VLTEVDREGAGLRHYLRVLRRRRLALALCVIAVVAAAVISSVVQTPIYAATAEVYRQTRPVQAVFNDGNAPYVDPQRALQTEIRVITSQPVRDAAREKLGYRATVTAAPIAQTDNIEIRAEDPSARRAADIANAYATAYIDFRKKQAVDDVIFQATEVQKKIADLQKQIDATEGDLKDTLIQNQALFKNRLSQLEVEASVQTGGTQLVNRAEVPTSPVRPRPVRNAVIALVLGLFFGVGVAFLLEYLDDSVKTKEDLDRAVPSMSVLSMIPAVAGWKAREEPKVVSLSDPSSAAAEAYRTLRTSVQFLALDRPVRAIQVTSANAQEGKTTTLANLGVALARAGARVVIVCSDLRRPRVHEFFGLDNKVGFTSVLLGEVSLNQAVQRVPGVERLYLLASGPLPPNPSELLQSKRAADVLSHLQSEGNFLLIDSPPVLPVTDALVLSKRVDGTVIVCAAGKTARKEVARSVEMLRQVDAPIIGAVLNGLTEAASYGYTYEYYRTGDYAATNGNGASGNGAKKRDRARSRSQTRKDARK